MMFWSRKKEFFFILAIVSSLSIIIIAFLIQSDYLRIFQKTKSAPVATPITETALMSPSPSQTHYGVMESNQERLTTVFCGSDEFIFRLVQIGGYSYNTNIYKTEVNPNNLVISIKPTGNTESEAFFVLGAPKNNCDRIYLTTGILNTDAPMRGIYVWQTGTKEVRELTVGKNFSSYYIGLHNPQYPNFPYGDWAKNAVSPDGEKMIVARPGSSRENKLPQWSCGLQTLSLLNLREDTSSTLTQLVGAETLDSGTDEIGGCTGVNIGWLNQSTTYYDVYTVTASGGVSLKERRTLGI